MSLPGKPSALDSLHSATVSFDSLIDRSVVRPLSILVTWNAVATSPMIENSWIKRLSDNTFCVEDGGGLRGIETSGAKAIVERACLFILRNGLKLYKKNAFDA